ncbi:unnamed protein product [Closterium sp. NIES-54]
MEIARTSMIHAAAPHFLWPFAVQYAAHQLNLWPRVSLPETSPALRWSGKFGDALVFRVWGSRAFVRDTSADKLSARAIPCVFLGFVPNAPGWQSYHPTSRRVLPSQDVTIDESVPFYHLFPYRSAPHLPLPLFLAPGPPPLSRAVLAEPRPPYLSSSTATATATASSATATLAMASPPVLSFDAEGRPIKFETWLDDLHLFLQLTAREDISLYDHALGTVPPPATTAAATARSQWQTRDAHARFAIRNSLPVDEREHFGQHQTAQALYTAVVARYSSPASATLGRLSLPYLFPDLSAFQTVADLITHLRTSDARFRAAMPAEFLASNPPPLWTQGPAPSGVSQIDPLLGVVPVQVAVGSGAAPGAASGGAASGGTEPGGAGSEGAGSGGADPGAAEPEGVEPGGAESEGAESGGAAPRGATSSGGPAGASQRMFSQQLREWLVRRAHCRSGAPGAAGAGDTGAGGDAVTTGAGGTGGTAATSPGRARTSASTGGAGAGGAGVGGPGAGGAGAAGAGVGGTGAGGAGAAGAGAVDPGARGAGGTVRPRSYFVPLLQQALGVPSSTGLPPPFLCLPPDQTQPPLQTASPLPTPSPYTEQSEGLTERREPASRPVSPVRTTRRAPRSRPPPVPSSYAMALRPSSVPLRVPLPTPPESSLHEVPDPAFDRARAASPIVSRLLATAVTDPSFESAAASALVAELLDFAAACRLDYASALVAESESACPPSVGGECALGTDVLEDKQEDFECLAAALPHFASMLLAPEGDPDAPDIPTPRSYAEAITGPYSSQWQAAMDAEMAS